MESVRLTREELYQAAWSEPMRTLAQKFGISDVGLAKNCKRLKVPVPGRGYWAKKAAGQTPRRKPLPVLPPNTPQARLVLTLTPSLPASAPSRLPNILAAQYAFEADPQNLILVKETLRSAQPLVRQTVDALKNRSGNSVHHFRPSSHLDIQVSAGILPRALRVMDALVTALELRGWKVSIGTRGSETDTKTFVTVLGQRVPFGIREKIRKVANKGTGSPWDPKYRDEPSGKLALVLRSRWGTAVERSLEDMPERQVEDRLNDFVFAIVERAYNDLTWDAQAEDSQRERHVEEQRRTARERARQKEKQGVDALEQQAAAWTKSQMLRAYLLALRQAADHQNGITPLDKSFSDWLTWAEAHASAIDPLRTPLKKLAEVGEA